MTEYLLSNKKYLSISPRAWIELRQFFSPQELFDIEEGKLRSHKDLILCYNEHRDYFPDTRIEVSDLKSAKVVVQGEKEILVL